jgi:hypothetical protein
MSCITLTTTISDIILTSQCNQVITLSQSAESCIISNTGSQGIAGPAGESGIITLTTTGTSGASTLIGTTLNVPNYVAGGGGDVSKVGTPVNNQIGIWTGDGTIEGDSGLTYDSGTTTLATDIIAATGAISGSNLSGTNTGDQTSIVGLTGTKAEFNDALTDGSFNYIFAFTTISTDTTLNLTTHKYIKVDTSSGDVTLTLPLSAAGLQSYDIWKISSDSNKVIIARDGSDLIIGDTAFEWSSQWAHYEFVPDNATVWLVK